MGKKGGRIKNELYGRSPAFDAMSDLKHFKKFGGKPMERRTGIKFIKRFPQGEPIVSMIEFKSRIIVATAKRIYELKEDKIIPIKIRVER